MTFVQRSGWSAVALDRRVTLAPTALAQVGAVRRRVVARRRKMLAAATATIICLSLLSLSTGSFGLDLLDVARALAGHGDDNAVYSARHLRLPRLLAALMVGATFGISGAMFQSLVRNPLASPDIIGITMGASFAAVVVIVVIGETTVLVTAGALGGAVALSALTLGLSFRRSGRGGAVAPARLVLVGIGLQAMLGAWIGFLLVRTDDTEQLRVAQWTVGSLNNRTWGQLALVALSLVVLVPAVVALRQALSGLQLGEDAAGALGVAVARRRTAVVVVGALLAAVGTAVAGPIAFVAFLAAPIARRALRSPGPAVAASAVTGAGLLVLADVVGRRAFPGFEIPVGTVTGICGAPYLLWLLARGTTERSGS